MGQNEKEKKWLLNPKTRIFYSFVVETFDNLFWHFSTLQCIKSHMYPYHFRTMSKPNTGFWKLQNSKQPTAYKVNVPILLLNATSCACDFNVERNHVTLSLSSTKYRIIILQRVLKLFRSHLLCILYRSPKRNTEMSMWH